MRYLRGYEFFSMSPPIRHCTLFLTFLSDFLDLSSRCLLSLITPFPCTPEHPCPGDLHETLATASPLQWAPLTLATTSAPTATSGDATSTWTSGATTRCHSAGLWLRPPPLCHCAGTRSRHANCLQLELRRTCQGLSPFLYSVLSNFACTTLFLFWHQIVQCCTVAVPCQFCLLVLNCL